MLSVTTVYYHKKCNEVSGGSHRNINEIYARHFKIRNDITLVKVGKSHMKYFPNKKMRQNRTLNSKLGAVTRNVNIVLRKGIDIAIIKKDINNRN